MSAGDIMLASSTDFLISLRADILNETPRLKALKEKVFANPGIAKYVKDRPKTDVWNMFSLFLNIWLSMSVFGVWF